MRTKNVISLKKKVNRFNAKPRFVLQNYGNHAIKQTKSTIDKRKADLIICNYLPANHNTIGPPSTINNFTTQNRPVIIQKICAIKTETGKKNKTWRRFVNT